MNAQRRETEAQVARVFATLERLPIYDRHEFIRETLDERLRKPEPTNRLWAAQTLPMIYRRLKYHIRHPNDQDIRQFVAVVTPDDDESSQDE